MGGFEVPIRDLEFPGIGELLSEIHSRFLQDSGSFDPVDKDYCRFLLGPEQQTTFENLRKRLYEALILTLLEGIDILWYTVMRQSWVWVKC